MGDASRPPDRTAPALPEPRISERDLARLVAWARLEMPWRAERGPGFRLFWLRGERGLRWTDLVGPSSHAVVGRHPGCDVVLDEDPTLSLRHLLVTTAALDGGYILRVLDLNARAPFFLDDQRPRRSVVTADALALRLGKYVIGALPIDANGTIGGVRERAPEMHVDEAGTLPDTLPTSPYRLATSRVVSLPALGHVGDTPSFPVYAGAAAIMNQPAHRRPHLKVTVSRGAHGASTYLHRVELEKGVLIGRSTRCLDAGLRAVLHHGISRVHLLLLSHGGRDELIDLGSTQGTFEGKQRVRRLELARTTEIVLAGDEPVRVTLQKT